MRIERLRGLVETYSSLSTWSAATVARLFRLISLNSSPVPLLISTTNGKETEDSEIIKVMFT